MTPAARYRQVAELHASNIDQGFLGSLGVRFLALLYRAIDEAPESVLIVEERCGSVVGFVAGSGSMRAIYRGLLHRPISLALALFPSLFRPARVWRILELLTYGRSRGGHADGSHAELLSIAVAPEVRGQGVSTLLYRRLLAHFRDRGIQQFRIIVGEALVPAHRFYQRMGAAAVDRVEVHGGEGSVVYVQTVSRLD